jgi:hydrogenase maturation factor
LKRKSQPVQPLWEVPMRYIDEYRDPKIAQALVDQIHARVTKPSVLMEICGGKPTL